jgi:hypothetical protein
MEALFSIHDSSEVDYIAHLVEEIDTQPAFLRGRDAISTQTWAAHIDFVV